MFGLSWIEMAFCAVLAIVVIGPRDLPRFARSLGSVARTCRRVYAEVQGSLAQLEREIESSGPRPRAASTWQDYLPPEIRELRAAIKPHSNDERTAEQYRQVRAAVTQAKADYAAARAAEEGSAGS